MYPSHQQYFALTYIIEEIGLLSFRSFSFLNTSLLTL